MVKSFTDIFIDFSPSDYAAWYGAIISSLALIFTLLKDRPKVRIRLNRDLKITGHPNIPSTQRVCTIEVINLGKNPVSLQTVGFYVNSVDKPKHLFGASLGSEYPKILTQENPKTEIPAPQDGIDFKNILYVWAKDNKDNEYRLYLSKIPTIRLLILKLKSRIKSDGSKN